MQWLTMDLEDLNRVHILLKQHQKSFDIIISNPPWHIAMWIIKLCQQLLTPKGKCFMILPSNYFYISKHRRSALQLLTFKIQKQYPVGVWNYYLNLRGTTARQSDDSIYILSFDDNINDSTFTVDMSQAPNALVSTIHLLQRP